MKTAALRAFREGTRSFIEDRASEIVLIPRRREISGDGVRWVDLPARAPQIMRLIDQSGTDGPRPGSLDGTDGVNRIVTFQLLGEYDAVIEINDYWVDELGRRHEVADLLPPNGYEQRAQVVRYGE